MIAPAKSSGPNIVDSSAWLEYFAGGPGAGHFATAIETVDHLIVPAICLVEVFKVVLRQRGESDALQAVALMRQGTVVDLDASLALMAGRVGVEFKLPLADSIVYATALSTSGSVWTQDQDFEGLPGVRYFPKHAAK